MRYRVAIGRPGGAGMIVPADPPGDGRRPVNGKATGVGLTTTELPGSFAALGVAPELVSALESQGITEPFPIQALTIADALAGRDVCGKAKTGSGKTLAFGVPMLQRLQEGGSTGSAQGLRTPRGLVLVPTRELARQVADVLLPLAEKAGLQLAACYGGAGHGRSRSERWPRVPTCWWPPRVG